METSQLTPIASNFIAEALVYLAHDTTSITGYNTIAHGEISIGYFTEASHPGRLAARRVTFVADEAAPTQRALGIFGSQRDQRRDLMADIAKELEDDTALVLTASDTVAYECTGQNLLSHFTLRDLITSCCLALGLETPEPVGNTLALDGQIEVFTRLLKRYPVIICDLPDSDLEGYAFMGSALTQALMSSTQEAGQVLLFTCDAPSGSELGDELWDASGAAVDLKAYGSGQAHLVRIGDEPVLPFEPRVWV